MRKAHLKNPGKGLTTEEIDRIIKEYEDGKSATKIAEEMFLYQGKVIDILDDHGVRRHNKLTHLDRNTLLQVLAWEHGDRQNAAKALGISRGSLSIMVRELGVRDHLVDRRKGPTRSKQQVEETLKKCHGDRISTALELGVHPATISNLVKRYGLQGMVVRRKVQK